MSGYGYVHKRPVPPEPEANGVGFIEDEFDSGEASAGFTAPGCGGEETETALIRVRYLGETAASVRVRSVSGGHYTEGVDYEAVDEIVEFPTELTDVNGMYALVEVVISNPSAECPLPNDYSNPAIVLELSEATDCEIGGEIETVEGPKNLVGTIHLIANGI